MVFPSVPVHVDPPKWNQLGSGGSSGSDEPPQLPPPPPGLVGVEVGMHMPGTIAVRPGSMAERARRAKIAPPEQALKCPRCNSTNTKFCYFNNYSLSQPRHFCKTCRRYWTRGGAIRNVPVGGGGRRNKRATSGGSSSAKSNAITSANRQSGASSSARSGAMTTSRNVLPQLPPPPQLHPFPDCRTRNPGGLSFNEIQPLDAVDYGGGGSGGVGLAENLRFHQQIQQFPLILNGLETPLPPPQTSTLAPLPGLYPSSFIGEGSVRIDGQRSLVPSSGLLMQVASVKMEDKAQGVSLPRQYLNLGDFRSNNDLTWSGNSTAGIGSSSNNSGWASSTDNFLQ